MSAKKGLHPAIAFALMLLMLICALLFGANKAFVQKKAEVDAAYGQMKNAVVLNAETAHNLLTVAKRHLSADNALILSVKSDLDVMEDASRTAIDKANVWQQFVDHAQALLDTLREKQSVKNDSRDYMYAAQMLPQAVDMCRDMSSVKVYNEAAKAYNDALSGSFSGLLAGITGMDAAELIVMDD